MLTVLQVLPSLEGGGVERGTLEVAGELVRRGHRSLVMSSGGRLVGRLEQDGSRHFTWPIGKKSLMTLGYILPLRRFLRKHRVDIVHVRSRLPAWIVWFAWRGMDPAARPRLITTMHGLHSVSGYSAIMTRGERVIAVSDTSARYIRENYPQAPEDSIRVIHRGVDREVFPRAYKPSPQWESEWLHSHPNLSQGPVLTLAGRLTRLKGHRDFIRLIGALREQGLPVQGLVVGGEDPRRRRYAEELYRLVSDLKLEPVITFGGHRDDIREIYAASAIVFSLSGKPESFGRTVVEALSMGVPVVGYDHGGVGEVLARIFPEGRVPLDSQECLLEKTLEFLDTPPLVPPFEAFTLQSMLNRTLALYQELIPEKP
ncbi:MAG: glycosyltransferase family 4 protein [Gammaproteobacteria bacterium]|nr:glycosyltransferase family 4 protein [Gammaproteobacteria bacterium]